MNDSQLAKMRSEVSYEIALAGLAIYPHATYKLCRKYPELPHELVSAAVEAEVSFLEAKEAYLTGLEFDRLEANGELV